MSSTKDSTTVPQIVVRFGDYEIDGFEERVVEATAAALYGSIIGKLSERVEAKLTETVEEWTARTVVEEIKIPRLRRAGDSSWSHPEPDGELTYEEAHAYTSEAEGKTIHEHLKANLEEWAKRLETNTLASNVFNRTNKLNAICDRFLGRAFEREIEKAARAAAQEVKALCQRQMKKAVAAEASRLVRHLGGEAS